MSTWKNWAQILEQSDVDGAAVGTHQLFRTTSGNKILKAVRSAFIFEGAPTFTTLKMRLYAVNFHGLPGALIAESNAGGIAILSATSTQPVVMLDSWWGFDHIKLKENVFYAIAPYDPTYVRTASKFISWRKDYPDPVYTVNNTPELVTAGKQSFAVSFITAVL